jgi:micrococcal nuclease
LIHRRLVLVFAAALLSGCGGSGELDRLTAGETGRVVDVRSGDAFTLDTGLLVRLADVEAPHGSDPGAAEARDALKTLVLGQTVTLHYGGAHRDRYDRAIAQVRTQRHHAWVQRALLEAGRVRVHTWPDNAALVRPLLSAEAGARMAKRGVWALPAYQVRLPSEAAAAQGFTIMEGRVARITEKPGLVWLDFAEGGTAILVPGKARADFRLAGVNFQALQGHIVRARGRISSGVLTLDHPAALERLSN